MGPLFGPLALGPGPLYMENLSVVTAPLYPPLWVQNRHGHVLASAICAESTIIPGTGATAQPCMLHDLLPLFVVPNGSTGQNGSTMSTMLNVQYGAVKIAGIATNNNE